MATLNNVSYKSGSSGVDFATAAALHDAAIWVYVSHANVPTNTRNSCWDALSGATFVKRSIKWEWNWYWPVVTSAEYDVYVRPTTLTGGPLFNMHDISVANFVKNTTVDPATGFDYGGSHSETPTLSNTISSRATSNYYGLYIVAKFDVANGFQYKDW